MTTLGLLTLHVRVSMLNGFTSIPLYSSGDTAIVSVGSTVKTKVQT